MVPTEGLHGFRLGLRKIKTLERRTIVRFGWFDRETHLSRIAL